MKREDYKTGDRVRVVKLPPERIGWGNVEDGSRCLRNGDVITLSDPPTRPMDILHYGTDLSTIHDFGLCYDHDSQWIPVEWVELIKDDTHDQECKCNIMATGCTCGVFAAEQSSRNGGSS